VKQKLNPMSKAPLDEQKLYRGAGWDETWFVGTLKESDPPGSNSVWVMGHQCKVVSFAGWLDLPEVEA
jgi:hypothetical protein